MQTAKTPLEQVRELVDRDGPVLAARALGLTTPSLARLLAGMTVRRGTLAAVELRIGAALEKQAA